MDVTDRLNFSELCVPAPQRQLRLGMHRIPIFHLAGFMNSNPAGAGHENQHKTTSELE